MDNKRIADRVAQSIINKVEALRLMHSNGEITIMEYVTALNTIAALTNGILDSYTTIARERGIIEEIL